MGIFEEDLGPNDPVHQPVSPIEQMLAQIDNKLAGRVGQQQAQPGGGFGGVMRGIGHIGDILQSTAAGMRGAPNPVTARKHQEAQARMDQERLELQKQQVRFGKVDKILDILTSDKVDIPATARSQLFNLAIDSDPDLKATFGPFTGKGFTLSGKKKDWKREDYTVREGDVYKDPLTGEPLKVGSRWDLEGGWENGQPKLYEVRPSKSAAAEEKERKTEERFQQREERMEANQTRVAQQFQQSQQGIEARHAETVKALRDNRGFQNEDSLRKEFLGQTKTFQEVRDMFNRVSGSAKNPTPAGDLSLIFAYMKMLDPQSVVRESEFRVAETARPMLEKAGLSWNRLQSVWEGKRLTDSQRADFLSRAKGIYGEQEKTHKQTVGEFRRTAASYGLNPDRVTQDMIGTAGGDAPSALPSSPPPGNRPGRYRDKQGVEHEFDGQRWIR